MADLTKREQFAMAALQGLLSDHKDHGDELLPNERCSDGVARLAVEHADALIKALRNTSEP